jgi:hypothetical protein
MVCEAKAVSEIEPLFDMAQDFSDGVWNIKGRRCRDSRDSVA